LKHGTYRHIGRRVSNSGRLVSYMING